MGSVAFLRCLTFIVPRRQAPVMEFDLDALLAPSTAKPSCKSPAVASGETTDHREVVAEAQSSIKQEAASPEMQPPPPKDPFVVSPPPAHWTTANTVPHVGSRCRAQMKGEWCVAQQPVCFSDG